MRPLLLPRPAVRLRPLVLALALAATGRTADGPALTIDCARCGPDQTWPHECAEGMDTAGVTAELIATARAEHRRLLAIPGLRLPDLGPVTTAAELADVLTRLLADLAASVVASETEAAGLADAAATAGDEHARRAGLAERFAAEIVQLHREREAADREAAEQIRAAVSARDEVRRLQQAHNALREEIRQARNRLFPRLQAAANRGWVLPPSNYRPLPAPLPPALARAAASGASLAPVMDATDDLRAPSGLAPVLPPTTALAPTMTGDLARAALARRSDALRTLERERSDLAAQSVRLSELESQRISAATQLAAARRNETAAVQAATEYSRRVTLARSAARYAWIEWSLFAALDRQAEALLTNPPADPPAPGLSRPWSDLAATAVRLGSDPIGTIAQWPTLPSTRAETLTAVRADLTRTRDTLGQGLSDTPAELPPDLQPYLAPLRR
jgi:hypothetical protein